jgi:pyruvate formate lyase activating enzyme
MLDITKLAKKEGIKNTIVSNGFINEEPLKELCKYLDGVNIDLKSIKNKFYKDECKAWIDPVLDSLKLMKKKKIWVEVTNLLIPTLNDGEKEIKELSKWVKDNLGISVPLHFSAFYPCYERIDLQSTPPSKVKKAREIARDIGLKYVYSGNIMDWESNSTFCPKCKKLLIKRLGFHVVENNLDKGKCKFCKEKIEGVWS